MRTTTLLTWLLALTTARGVSAQNTTRDARWVACRHDGVLEVTGEVAQDLAGLKHLSARFTLAPGADGGSVCAPLAPLKVDLDARLVPSQPTAAALDTFERDGTGALLTSPFSAMPLPPLHRTLELRSKRTLVGTLPLSLHGSPVEVDAFDVGDGRHTLLAVTWVSALSEGVPVRDVEFVVIPRAAPGRDARVTLTVPATEFGWPELTRWTEAVASGLERRRSASAPAFRALVTRRQRQQTLARTPAFVAASDACTTAANSEVVGPDRWQPLCAAIDALRSLTSATDWPLVLERLEWSRTDCLTLVERRDAGACSFD